MTDKTAIQPEAYWRQHIASEIDRRRHDDPCDCTFCTHLTFAANVARGTR
jgi:hypothetical protein